MGQPDITIIAAVDRTSQIIGINQDIPWKLRSDLKHFKEQTMGGVLIMGRLTFESIGRPLPGRSTVVLSRRPLANWNTPRTSHEGFDVAASMEEAIALAESYKAPIFAVGGRTIYEQLLGKARYMLISWVFTNPGDIAPEASDKVARFPAVDWDQWTLADSKGHSRSQHDQHAFSVCKYRRRR